MACEGMVNVALGEDAGTREPFHWVLSRVDSCRGLREVWRHSKEIQPAGGGSDL